MSGALSTAAAGPQESPPSGIRGWLAVPAVGLVFAPVVLLVATIKVLRTFFSPKLPGLESLNPGLLGCLVAELLLNIALLAFCLFAAAAFFRKRRYAPQVVIAFYSFNLLGTIGLALWTETVLPAYQPDGAALGRAIVIAVVWIPYFIFSKRVRNTFVLPAVPADVVAPGHRAAPVKMRRR